MCDSASATAADVLAEHPDIDRGDGARSAGFLGWGDVAVSAWAILRSGSSSVACSLDDQGKPRGY
jgi:hypothetical protein